MFDWYFRCSQQVLILSGGNVADVSPWSIREHWYRSAADYDCREAVGSSHLNARTHISENVQEIKFCPKFPFLNVCQLAMRKLRTELGTNSDIILQSWFFLRTAIYGVVFLMTLALKAEASHLLMVAVPRYSPVSMCSQRSSFAQLDSAI